ncbi:MAG TPA: NAD(P)-dependent oxidoreductase [Bacteroidia bacterium]|nr:NAD(P)-dependent oxidoreductase [Bacteroidia bacterium]
MKNIKIGILREEKVPHDKRVPFSPEQCKLIKSEYPGVEVVIQPCSYRSFRDDEYRREGVVLQEDLSDCDILIGIKEVPKDKLIAGKKYLYFSHTIKKQPHNREMLKKIIRDKITLVDYECLVDDHENRIIGFGRYAGIVGAYNGIMAYGLKYGLFNLKAAHQSFGIEELHKELDSIKLPNIKIVITGGGRVANGAIETMGMLNIRKVTPFEFLNYSFREPVYVQLHSENYYERKDGSDFSKADFYHYPEKYNCTFCDPGSYSSFTDLLVHCAYWNPNAAVLFTKEDMRSPAFRISVIADVTCDINGSIPSTHRATTIEDKFYGYNPVNEKEEEAFSTDTITVMSIDNLPCELPRDASEGFGKHLIERVIPLLIGHDKDNVIYRATIARNGELTPRFAYLTDYIS